MPYDFRRPIQLSREQSRLLQLGFDELARQSTTLFTSALRSVCSVTLVSVDQRSYAEYIASLDPLTYLTMFTAEPIPGRCMLDLPIGAAMSCVDHLLGGPGSGDQPQRPLTDIEAGVTGAFVGRLLGELRYCLDGILTEDPVIVGTEDSPQFAQVAGASDTMLVATFDLHLDDTSHRVTLTMPFSGLVPHLARAVAPAPLSERERSQRARSADLMSRTFHDVPVEVAVRLRPTRVAPETFVGLAVGDVIRLAHPAAAPLDVCADGAAFAHATAGSRGPRLAALIVGTSEENR
ncbi:flagellar motor switch protein FliM [Lapillicoccus jejuensis]|uniref:Flagellar motor switch protein FliM n=1 Tax=Lapillicoccus jejuensis TaxID=402171 RepID=A0A542E478_9MICO|nr:flagellar motor switch protein FliM [Lapillicoccus jejuensis]TQJ10153.1 flagellar motor switch protein FliM [Lapillicoccus jejuensis]